MSIGGERLGWMQKYGSASYTRLYTNKAVCVATDAHPFTVFDASNQGSFFTEGGSCFVFENAVLPVFQSYHEKTVNISLDKSKYLISVEMNENFLALVINFLVPQNHRSN